MRQTLGDYIRQRRLLLAAVELRNTERPIFDIAMDLGYVSQQTFSRVFRREFDRTPATTATACSITARAASGVRAVVAASE